jgi:tetratricopeptide (TPR) repeat protein
MSSLKSASLAVLIALTALTTRIDARADFPGQGDPSAWSDAIPYYNLANKYLEKDKYEDAVDNYHEAIARYSFDPDFYVNLGYCYRKLGDFESAEQAFRQAIKLNDKDWISWSNLANALLKQKRLPETIKTFEKCLKLNPPAKEKEAILRDIGDIKKVLANQAPPPITDTKSAAFKPAVKSATPSKNAARASTVAPVKDAAAPKNAPPSASKPESSGWDYVYK